MRTTKMRTTTLLALGALALWVGDGCHSAPPRHSPVPSESRLVPLAANRPAEPDAPNPELLRLYREDQNDRNAGAAESAEVNRRDAARRIRVHQIVSSGGARVADDYFHAAMVFQHGDTVDDYEWAHHLAMTAVGMDPAHRDARWLAAATKDRALVAAGKPQLYGTQFRRGPDGTWKQYPIDPSVTDEERERWGVPPLGPAAKPAPRADGAGGKRMSQKAPNR